MHTTAVKNKLSEKERKRLRQTYYDVSDPASYGGVNRLSQKTRIHPEKVSKWLGTQLPYALHKPARKKFQRRRYVSRGLNFQWQADLMDMQKYSRENEGNRYILIVIDVFSRQLYAVPVKSKHGAEIARALSEIFKIAHPKYLQTDQGLEFYNWQVKRLLADYNVELFSVYSIMKAAIVERSIRTIKEKLFKIFTHRGNYKWIDVLPQVLQAYNNSYHRGLKHIPSNVNKMNETDVWLKQYADLKKPNKVKFQLGDRVRISKQKQLFTKGYLQNWTDEVFTVTAVNLKYNPVQYTLTDDNNEVITGSFYDNELQRAAAEEYRIERILRTKMETGGKKTALVKWKGYDIPSWIDFNKIKSINVL